MPWEISLAQSRYSAMQPKHIHEAGAPFNNLAHVLAEQGRYAEALQMAIRAVDIGGANKSLYLQTLQEVQAIIKNRP